MNAEAQTRILFVDDEPLILEVLKLTVETMKPAWAMAFANSGAEALGLMARQPFDIVISDMRMPGMTGAQLLNEVMKRYPATVRIILSGYAEQELVMKCVGATHQYLGKPFELHALQVVLQRVKGLKERLHSAEIQGLLGRKQHLPSLPAVYVKILEALQQPDCPVERIGEIVSSDPALTSKLLQLVNSAFFGFAREISNANEAVMLLGVGTIRSLALSLHLFSTFEATQTADNALTQVWSHSLRVAQLSKRLAQLQNSDEKLIEEAFTAGLLHDVGKLILAENPATRYLELMAGARRDKHCLVQAEQAAFQATHAEVGAYLLDLWGLPVPLVEAVAWHHEPSRTAYGAFSPLAAVHIANFLEQESSNPEGALQAPLDQAYLEQLGLQQQLELWRRERNELLGPKE